MKKDEIQNIVDEFSAGQGNYDLELEVEGLDFRGVDLENRNLSGAVLPGGNFSGMELVNVDFFGANLGGADFSNSVLRNVDFTKAKLDNCNFTQTRVIGGSWFRATCQDAVRDGLTFYGTDLRRTFPDISGT